MHLGELARGKKNKIPFYPQLHVNLLHQSFQESPKYLKLFLPQFNKSSLFNII